MTFGFMARLIVEGIGFGGGGKRDVACSFGSPYIDLGCALSVTFEGFPLLPTSGSGGKIRPSARGHKIRISPPDADQRLSQTSSGS